MLGRLKPKLGDPRNFRKLKPSVGYNWRRVHGKGQQYLACSAVGDRVVNFWLVAELRHKFNLSVEILPAQP